MKFDIITIFPDLFNGFLTESLLARVDFDYDSSFWYTKII